MMFVSWVGGWVSLIQPVNDVCIVEWVELTLIQPVNDVCIVSGWVGGSH